MLIRRRRQTRRHRLRHRCRLQLSALQPPIARLFEASHGPHQRLVDCLAAGVAVEQEQSRLVEQLAEQIGRLFPPKMVAAVATCCLGRSASLAWLQTHLVRDRQTLLVVLRPEFLSQLRLVVNCELWARWIDFLALRRRVATLGLPVVSCLARAPDRRWGTVAVLATWRSADCSVTESQCFPALTLCCQQPVLLEHFSARP